MSGALREERLWKNPSGTELEVYTDPETVSFWIGFEVPLFADRRKE